MLRGLVATAEKQDRVLPSRRLTRVHNDYRRSAHLGTCGWLRCALVAGSRGSSPLAAGPIALPRDRDIGLLDRTRTPRPRSIDFRAGVVALTAGDVVRRRMRCTPTKRPHGCLLRTSTNRPFPRGAALLRVTLDESCWCSASVRLSPNLKAGTPCGHEVQQLRECLSGTTSVQSRRAHWYRCPAVGISGGIRGKLRMLCT